MFTSKTWQKVQHLWNARRYNTWQLTYQANSKTPVIVNTTLKYALNFPNKQNEFNE